MLTPSRLSLARRRRGFTKVQLAREAEISVKSITDYEKGDANPMPETAEKLAKALGFPLSFFEAPDLPELTPEETTFRSLSKLSAGKRDMALTAATLAIDFHRWISERFKLPAVAVPAHEGEDPEQAANVLRAEWGLGDKPIPNMIHLLEAHGVRVFSLEEDYKEVDAFSRWLDGIPFVFLNTFKTAERSRMDAAHELGHLVLHRHGQTTLSRHIEEEAKRFASALLMPASGLRNPPNFPSLDQLIALKRKWRVSLAALTFRLHELGAITDWHYRSLNVDISRRGYRTKEPREIERETSEIMRKVLMTLRSEGVSVVDIARELHLPLNELNAFISGFAILPVEGGREVTDAKDRPPLTVIEGGSQPS